MQNSTAKPGRLRLVEMTDAEQAYSWNLTSAPPRVARRSGLVSGLGRLAYRVGVLLWIALLSMGSYMLISRYFVQEVEVVGEGMAPTLRGQDHYLLNRWTFRFNLDKPQVREVVVIVDPDDHKLGVSRIVAIPGDSIRFLNGRVYVNGGELPEPYLTPNTRTFINPFVREQTIQCGENEYFVLGDNRTTSIDSRHFGPVHLDNIVGLLTVN